MHNIKIVTVGDDGVGKTSMLIAYASNQFPNEYVPTVMDDYTANVDFHGKQVSIALWDTTGKDEHSKLRPLSYPKTNVFILCYSVDNTSSLENLHKKWKPEISSHCPGIPFIVVCTKTDLRDNPQFREMMMTKDGEEGGTFAMGKKVADEMKAGNFLEVSAMKGVGVKEVINAAIAQVVQDSNDKEKCVLM